MFLNIPFYFYFYFYWIQGEEPLYFMELNFTLKKKEKKGNLFLNTTRQLQKFSSNAVIKKSCDYMRRVGSLAELACFSSPGQKRVGACEIAKILNNNSFFPGLKTSWRGAGSFELFPYNSELEPG